MKKNKFMRLAALLLVLTMVSTCAISGTYAKYVTKGTSSDSARVAKFGVTVTGKVGDENQMFSYEYAKADSEYTLGAVTVAAGTNVVAPGTKGTMSQFTVTGTPEVAVRVSYENVVVDLGDNWAINTEFYCPLKVTVNGITLYGLNYASADEFETAIANTIKTAKKDYQPGTNLSAVNADLAISWEWSFEDGVTYTHGTQTDEKDTYLGDRAAEDAAATIKIEVTCTITQID